MKLQIVMELGSTEAIKRAVAAKLGVSIVSPFTIQWEVQNHQLVALKIRETGFERQFHLVFHQNRQVPGLVQAFVETLRNQ